MTKNNNLTNTLLLIIISLLLLILIVMAWLFLSKTNFTMASSGNSFGKFKDKELKASSKAVPSELKWTDPFEDKKEKEKPQGSYLQYLSEQNKSK